MADFGLRTPDLVGLVTGGQVLEGYEGVASALSISEVSGAGRSITLRGRAMPYAPLSFGASMQTSLTWYQGNPRATQQVLGPRLEPTKMEGVWKDRFMFGAEVGGGSSVLVNGSPDEARSVEQLVELMYDFLQSGSELRVIWGSEVRVGVMRMFHVEWQRRTDAKWEAEFEWSGRGEFVPRQVDDPVGPDDLVRAMNTLDDILAFSPEDTAAAFNAQLLATVDDLRERVGILFSALRTVNTLIDIPGSVLGKIQSTSASILAELTEEIGRLTESSAGAEDEGASATTRPAGLLRVEAHRRTTARRAADVRATTDALTVQTDRRVSPDEVFVLDVPEDTSLYALSTRYYGTPDFAHYLARSNKLTSSVVLAGTQIRIPPRPPAGADGSSPSGMC